MIERVLHSAIGIKVSTQGIQKRVLCALMKLLGGLGGSIGEV